MPRCFWMRSRPSTHTVRLSIEFLAVILLAEEILFPLVQLCTPDAIGMMCFVIHDQDVALATDFVAEDTFNQFGVAFDIANRLHGDRLEVALSVLLLVEDGD